MMSLIEFIVVVVAVIEAKTFQSLLQSPASLRNSTGDEVQRSASISQRLRPGFPIVSLAPTKNERYDIFNITKYQKSEPRNMNMYRNNNTDNKHMPTGFSMSNTNIVQNKNIENADSLPDNAAKNINEHMIFNETANLEQKVSSEVDQNEDFFTNMNSIANNDNESKSLKRQRRNAPYFSFPSEIMKPFSSHILKKHKDHNLLYEKRRLQRNQKCTCVTTTCDLSSCDLTTVPQDLPSKITDLQLNSNDITTLTTNAFLRYECLEHLVLRNNKLSVVEDGAFNGLSRLTVLDLSSNLIGTYANLSEHIFESLKSLRVLHVSSNSFSCFSSPPYPDLILAHLHSLQELSIDNHGNQEYGPGFRNLTSLRNLTLACECAIDHLSNTSFQNIGQISLLNIRDCGIHGMEIDSGAFSHLTNLETLDISENPGIGFEYLPVVLWSLKTSKLQTLLMDRVVSEFSINFINSSITKTLPAGLTTVSARYNNILTIDNDGVKCLPKTLKLIDLSDNYMILNPEDISLDKIEGLETLFINSNSEECFISSYEMNYQFALDDFNFYHSEKQTGKGKHEIRINNFPQQVGTRIPWNLKRVQVSLKSLPVDFLSHIDENNNLEELDMRCSLLSELDFYSFVTLRRLRFLNVGRSSIENLILLGLQEISPLNVLILESNKLNDFLNSIEVPFDRLNNLVYLDISLNQIDNLQTDVFYGLDQLQHIRLNGNPFSRFSANISHMGHLKMLNISSTGLPNLPQEVRLHIDYLTRIRPAQITVDMADCPIQCDCFNLDFLKWMVSSPAFDKNFKGYKCRNSDTSTKYILDGYKEIISDLHRQCANNYPVFLVILAATLILLCAVTGAVVYRFRWNIRYLYYAAYIKIMDKNKKDNNHEFIYDVFLSYDSEDQRFVTRYLSPELEERGLKLLIHTRDFMAGTYITSNIVMAVAESRKTLVVLTRNLLESTWCNFEVQMATMEAVHTGRRVLVFLLKENIPNRELDVELLRYIKSNTYLPYPEDEGDEEVMKSFYDKLAHDLKS